MFADKLQNPFLKPSPFAASAASYTPSYTPSYVASSRTPPKYSSYTPYQDARPSLPVTSNQYSHYQHHYNPHSSHAFETKDIDSILSKNPFNKQYKPSFGVSRANRDLSPSRAASNTYDLPSSYDSYDNYGVVPRSYQSSRPSALQGARYTDSASRLTPTKKYDNYLSTSSADSATTYINKIYDLDQDKVSVKETSKPLVNPFFRKNLLKASSDPEPATNDYDSMALKYMGYKMDDQRQKELYQTDNYQTSYRPQKVESSLNRGLSFGTGVPNADPYAKYLDNFDNKYQSRSSLDRQGNVEDIYGTSGFGQDPRGNIGSSKNIQPKKPSYPEPKYNQYDLDNYQPKFGNNHNNAYDYGSTFNKKPESSKYIDNGYEKYNKDDYKTSLKIEKQPYHYNLDGEYERAIKEDIGKFVKNGGYGGKEEDVEKFGEDRVGFQEESEEDITKYQGYNYQGKFQTLGGKGYSINPKQHEYKHKQYEQGTSFGGRQPYKFTSSQVDEYKNPQDMEKKIKQNKYRKLGLQNQYERQPKSNKGIPIDQNYQDYARPQLSKGPSRDSAEHPRILEINGILFHRIEVM